MMSLAERLRKARTAKNLSQSELARLIGVKPQAIQAIEAGNVQKPRNIVAIAKAVGMEPGELLTGDKRSGLPPIRDDEQILAMLARIEGLTETDIRFAFDVIKHALELRRAVSSQTATDDPPRPATPRRVSQPSR